MFTARYGMGLRLVFKGLIIVSGSLAGYVMSGGKIISE